MKRILSGAVISALLIPGLTFAQTTDNTALIQQLYQLLAVLEQEIAQIEATQALTTPTQSTAPQTAQTTPLFGATIQTTQTMPTDQSSITIGQTKMAPNESYPNGYFVLKVAVLDSNGVPVNKAPITMQFGSTTQNATTDTLYGPNNANYFHNFNFFPQDASATITFTSGNLTNSITI